MFSVLWITILVLMTFAISAWNAFASGLTWKQSKRAGGFERLVDWSAISMSWCGFFAIAAILVGLLTLASGHLSQRAFSVLISPQYLMIIGPVICGAIVITIHSWIIARRSGSFIDTGVAVYNTYATGSDIYHAANGGISSAARNVFEFFSPDSDDDLTVVGGKLAILLILAVAAVLGGGAVYLFFSWGMRRSEPRATDTSPATA